LCGWILAELGPDVPLHFSAFHPDFKMLDVPPTPLATLQRARTTALDAGLRYVYTGNVHDPAADITACASCGTALIERDWYVILAYRLTADGCCPSCGTPVPGRFSASMGRWGRRSLPLQIG
jgi:pyruvate formate lyase activating enzyme